MTKITYSRDFYSVFINTKIAYSLFEDICMYDTFHVNVLVQQWFVLVIFILTWWVKPLLVSVKLEIYYALFIYILLVPFIIAIRTLRNCSMQLFHWYELYSMYVMSLIILHIFIDVWSTWFINYIITFLCMTLFAQIFTCNSRSCLFRFFLEWLIESLESCNWNIKFITYFTSIFCWYCL